jgi:hypothetical protein
MRSILLKDFLEHRLNFIIILIVAIVSLLGAAWFKVLDEGVATLLLFVFQAPLFVLLLSNHSISSEVNTRTFPFLVSLPISRTRLWFTKLLFLIIFTVIIYLIFSLLWLAAVGELDALFKLIAESPALTIMLPFIVLSFGYFSSMLPQGFGFLAGLILLLPGAAIGLNEFTILSVNYELGSIILIVTFLALSAIVFALDRKMQSIWRGVKGLGLLTLALLIILGLWSILDKAAEAYNHGERFEGSISLMDGGNSLIFAKSSVSPFWDVRKRNEHSFEDSNYRLYTFDLKSGQKKQIGPRNTFTKKLTDKFTIIEKPRIFAGFLRGIDRIVIDSEGNELIHLPAEMSFHYGEEPIFVIDRGSFIYSQVTTSGNNKIIDFYLYEEGKGLKTVFSADYNQFEFSEFYKVPSPEKGEKPQVYIAGRSQQDKGKLCLISVPDKKRLLLPEPGGYFVTAVPDGLIFSRRKNIRDRSDRSREIVQLSLDGKISIIEGLNDKAKLCGYTQDKHLLAMLPADEQPHYVREEDKPTYYSSLIAINLENNMQTEICKLATDSFHYFVMHPSLEKGILHSITHIDNGKKSLRVNKVFDSNTLSVKHMPELDGITITDTWFRADKIALPDNQYALLYNGKILRVDLEKFSLEELTDLRTALKMEVSK